MEAATPVLCVDSAPTPKASSADDLRDAWSNPLPKDLFQVESQGEELDACTYGVGCALATLLSTMYEPVRQPFEPATRRSALRRITYLRPRPPARRDGSQRSLMNVLYAQPSSEPE